MDYVEHLRIEVEVSRDSGFVKNVVRSGFES